LRSTCNRCWRSNGTTPWTETAGMTREAALLWRVCALFDLSPAEIVIIEENTKYRGAEV
jgi:hypothetical protein